MSKTETVSYQSEGHVALITLNRPQAMNVFDYQMRKELLSAQEKAETDENIRVVVLTGNGRAFSAGTDLNEFSSLDGAQGVFDISVRDYKPIIDGVIESDNIYLAAINGFAGGVALSLCLGADLAIMANTATVFSPFADIGLVPDGGASWDLLNTVGYKRAFSAIVECTHLDAKTCLNLGLVNRIETDANLKKHALSWATELSERSPLSLRYTKKILRQATTLTREQTAFLESNYQMKCLNSRDAKKAISAFQNKRKSSDISAPSIWEGV